MMASRTCRRDIRLNATNDDHGHVSARRVFAFMNVTLSAKTPSSAVILGHYDATDTNIPSLARARGNVGESRSQNVRSRALA